MSKGGSKNGLKSGQNSSETWLKNGLKCKKW